MNNLDYFQPRLQCKTSQGQRKDYFDSQNHSISKPVSSCSRRTDIHKTETFFDKAPRMKDSKKVLFNACNEIDKVFPKERLSVKTHKMEFYEVKSESVRISIMELQYLLVKKGWFDDEIKDVMLKIASKVNR